jgi:hypothetical protein
MTNDNPSIPLTRAQKISATKRALSPEQKAEAEAKRQASRKLKQEATGRTHGMTIAAHLTPELRAKYALDRNPGLSQMIDAIYSIFRIHFLINNAIHSNTEYQSFIDEFNSIHTDNIISVHPFFKDQITIQYAAADIKKKYGNRAYSLWTNLFIRLSKGGRSKNGEIIISSWMIDINRQQELEHKINKICKASGSKDIDNRHHAFVEALITMESKSLEYTELQVVQDPYVPVGIAVVGVPKSKKIISLWQKRQLQAERKRLRKLYVKPERKLTYLQTRDFIKSLKEQGIIK